LAQPSVCSVITGAKNLDQLTSNVKAADWNLTTDELSEIDRVINGSDAGV
jgi:aryl-alcohol dehydrogenase-like predicted oxidoreductase